VINHDDEDEQVLKRVQAFDRETLAAIYDRYQRPIYIYIARQVGEEETARDLTADVFRRLLQALKQGNGPSTNLKAWLYRTAHNITVDYFRRQSYRRHLPLIAAADISSEDPVIVAERHLQTAEVAEAWQSLTPDQQQVIALKFMHELDNSEIAAVLHKEIGAVKSLQHRALAALRRELEQREKVVA